MTIQANQGFGVSVFGAVSSGGGGGGGGTPGGLDTQIQFNSSGSFGASAALTFVSPALTIGAQQTTQGQIVFANTAAGAFATTVQSSNSASAAWTLTLPATAGTANYALTTNGSGVSSWSQISLTAGVTGTLPLANGGTNANLTASNGGVVYSGASAFAVLSGTATAGQMLRSGASGAPSWSTATFPSTATSTGTLLQADGTNWVATTATFPSTATSTGTILRADGTNWVATTATYPTTTTANQLLYSSATNTVGGLTSANTSALVTNASGVPSFTSGGTANRVLRTDGTTVSFAQVALGTDVSGQLLVSNGGTGISSGTSGGVPYFSASGTIASSAALAANAIVIGGGAGAAPSTTTTGANILTFLGTPSSANLAAAVTDETGSGALVFGTSPTFTTSAIFPAGTTSAPGITTTGDTNTGIYFPGADILGLVSGGAERMRLGGPTDATPGGVVVNTDYAYSRFNVFSTGTPSTSGATSVGSSFIGALAASLNVGATTDGAWLNAAYANNAGVALDMRFMAAGVEKARIASGGNIVATGGGLILPAQATPTSKNAAATLTGAELITGALEYTGAADTITLPTGTTIEGALTWYANNVSLDWSVINTGSGTCTIAANGNTTVGALTVTNGTSGRFRIRRTATNTFTVYRMA